MRIALRTLGVVAALIFIGVVFIISVAVLDRQIDYDVSLHNVSIPKFQAMDLDYEQNNTFEGTLPFAGGAIIDIDNDGTEEIFLGGGMNQPDELFRF